MARRSIGMPGSSPHARGTRRSGDDRSHSNRFIPACAGNADRSRAHRHARPVHPRMRGEHITHADGRSRRLVHPRMRGERTRISTYAIESIGSSPHARGTRSSGNSALPVRRFIPACAGNTHLSNLRCMLCAVHPRMRGEHLLWSWRPCHPSGSSPHARGTPPGAPGARGSGRFIPACAGNTAHQSAPALQ